MAAGRASRRRPSARDRGARRRRRSPELSAAGNARCAASGAAASRPPRRVAPGSAAGAQGHRGRRHRHGRARRRAALPRRQAQLTATALRLSAHQHFEHAVGQARPRTALRCSRRAAGPQLDAAAQRRRSTGASVALTPAVATRLKQRAQAQARAVDAALGTLALTAASATPPPGPRPRSRPPRRRADRRRPRQPTATPGPALRRATTFAVTPANSTGLVRLRPARQRRPQELDETTSTAPFPPTCGLGSGAVTASGGAQRIEPASAYDHRFPVSVVRAPPRRLGHDPLSGRRHVHDAGATASTSRSAICGSSSPPAAHRRGVRDGRS